MFQPIRVCNNINYVVHVTADVLGTIDFVTSDGTVVFRTCETEKGKVVFQMVGYKLFCYRIFLLKFV